jgi:hypothetical protein
MSPTEPDKPKAGTRSNATGRGIRSGGCMPSKEFAGSSYTPHKPQLSVTPSAWLGQFQW